MYERVHQDIARKKKPQAEEHHHWHYSKGRSLPIDFLCVETTPAANKYLAYNTLQNVGNKIKIQMNHKNLTGGPSELPLPDNHLGKNAIMKGTATNTIVHFTMPGSSRMATENREWTARKRHRTVGIQYTLCLRSPCMMARNSSRRKSNIYAETSESTISSSRL